MTGGKTKKERMAGGLTERRTGGQEIGQKKEKDDRRTDGRST